MGKLWQWNVPFLKPIQAKPPQHIQPKDPNCAHFLILGDPGRGTPKQRVVMQHWIPEYYNRLQEQDSALKERPPHHHVARQNNYQPGGMTLLDGVLANGDLVYRWPEVKPKTGYKIPSGMPTRFYQAVYRPMRDLLKLNIPFYSVLGNHDVKSGFENQLLRYLNNERYQHVTVGNDLDLFMIDNTSLIPPYDNTYNTPQRQQEAARLGEQQLKRLDKELGDSTRPFKMVVMHYPLYTSDVDFDDPHFETLRQSLLPVLEKHGVGLVLTGHAHITEVIQGKQGPVQLTTGTTGKRGPISPHMRCDNAFRQVHGQDRTHLSSRFSFVTMDVVPQDAPNPPKPPGVYFTVVGRRHRVLDQLYLPFSTQQPTAPPPPPEQRLVANPTPNSRQSSSSQDDPPIWL